MSDSLRSHELQHARPPCPSPTAGVHSNSRPSSWWCHPAISFSVVPFSCPQSLPASESFPMSQLFAWGGQSTGVSALASFLPKNTQGWALRDPIKQALLSERGRCREAVGDSDSVPSSPTNLSCFHESVNLSATVTILCTYCKTVKLKIIWYSIQIPFLSICFILVAHGQDKCHWVRLSPLVYFF